MHGDASCPQLKAHVHCRNCPTYSAAAVALLDRDLPADHLADWSSHFAQGKEVHELEADSIFIFRIGAEWLALPAWVFNEVAELRAIHSLPHRRGGVMLGLANVRGELLICVSLGKVLGLEEPVPARPQARADRRLLVISREDRRMVFPVDQVHGIHRSDRRELRAAPATVAKAAANYIKAVLRWRDKTVGCLDEQMIFHTLERGLA